MTVNAGLRMLAGFFVLLTVVLAYWHHQAWLLFTAFVGLNLLQSAFSGWCPAMVVLRKLGFKQERPA